MGKTYGQYRITANNTLINILFIFSANTQTTTQESLLVENVFFSFAPVSFNTERQNIHETTNISDLPMKVALSIPTYIAPYNNSKKENRSTETTARVYLLSYYHHYH
jgi:hypothetical protein